MTKEDLNECGLPMAHCFTLRKVIDLYKDSLFESVATSSSEALNPSGSSSSSSSSIKSPTSLVRNSSEKRASPSDEPEPEPKKRATEHSPSETQDKFLYSHLHARKGDKAYVRVPIEKTLECRPDLIAAMKSGVLLPIARREAIDLLVSAMYQKIESWYPHTDAKEQLAKDIISVFPKLKSVAGNPWSAFYDAQSSTGHIQTCLNGKRSAFKVRARSKKSKAFSSSAGSVSQSSSGAVEESHVKKTTEQTLEHSEEDQIEISNLSLIPDSPENRSTIVAQMKKFFTVRQNMLQKHEPVEEILKKFPKMMSYQGALIDADFECLKGTVGSSFMGAYDVTYKNSILTYLAQHNSSIMQILDKYQDDTLKSIISLVALLPKYPWQTRKVGKKGGPVNFPSNSTIDCKKTFPHPAFMQVIGNNVDVSKHVSTFHRTRPDGSAVLQPYLLYVTDDFLTGQFYLKANYHTFHIGNSALRALEIIVKYHHVFDLEYDFDLAHFYEFIEFIFGLKTTLPAKMSTLVSTLKCIV